MWSEQTHDAPDITILQQSTRTARQDHRCTYCKGIIPMGFKYGYAAWIEDGDFATAKTCVRCDAIQHGYEPNEEQPNG